MKCEAEVSRGQMTINMVGAFLHGLFCRQLLVPSNPLLFFPTEQQHVTVTCLHPSAMSHSHTNDNQHGQCPSSWAFLPTTVGFISTVNSVAVFSTEQTACHSDMLAPKCHVSLSRQISTPSARADSLAIGRMRLSKQRCIWR